MRHTARTFIPALALLMACSAGVHAQVMRYQFKEKERLQYVLEQKTKSVAKLMGAEVKSDVGVTMDMVWEIVKVDAQGNAQIRFRVTHSHMTMESLLGNFEVDSDDKRAPNDVAGRMLAQMNKAFAAMDITATMLPTGEMKDVKVSEATVKAMKAIPSAEQFGDLAHPDNFKDMLSSIVFPAGPVEKGKSWNHKTDRQSPEGKISTEHVFTLEDVIDQDGVKLQKISLKPNIKVVQVDPKALMKVESVKVSGHVLFDNKAGRFMSSTIDQVKTGKIDVMGLTLDNNSAQTTTIRLKGQSAEEKVEAAGKIESVKIDETAFVEKSVATEELETVAGVARSFNVSRSFTPSIMIVGAGTVSSDLKAKIEEALDVTIGKKTSVKESVTLDGKDVTKINVRWVERYRRGTALASDGSTISFLVKMDLRFKLEKAK